ncbi:hypothetical protein RHSIM_Rhsim07G0063400 [Rhododendron simsii]|uniref:F-box associated domain-containing protein n=1 Tax=Rhododendron simsii TaxID=118357 RepID=A0A834GSN9_RHOSS|nr:hypothetical protein RHSIM_Rhsim07G0063400 [Rhododendron simsii]
MKDYGTQESWSKDYCIDTCTDHGRWLHGLYEPMSYLRNGAILLFHRLGNAVVYYDPKIEEFYFLKLRGIKSKFEAIAHTPSFISLKDAVGGVLHIMTRDIEASSEVEVLNAAKMRFPYSSFMESGG